MAKEYKEPHLDKSGAKALYKVLTEANNAVTKKKKKADSKKKK